MNNGTEHDHAVSGAAGGTADSIAIFCDKRIYQRYRARIDHERTVILVLDPEVEYSGGADSFCREFGISRKNLIGIPAGYFARYASPMRNGKYQGPVLPPLPVLDKLKIRLNPGMAEALYGAIRRAVISLPTEFCRVRIYSSGVIHSGYFIDCALLAAHAVGMLPHRVKNISVAIDISDANIFSAGISTFLIRAAMDEIGLAQTAAAEAPIRVNIGPYRVCLSAPLFDNMLFFNGETELAAPLLAYGSHASWGGWPCFDECDWDHIDYDGFTADPSVVARIRAYAAAARDGGMHLYVSGADHWVL